MNAVVSRFHFRAGVIGVLLLCAGASPAAWATPHSTIPSECAFQLDVGHRYFDGIELMTVLLKTPRFTLHTDTLGAWVPSGQPCESAGFSFHYRTVADLNLCLSVLPSTQDAASEDYWDGYVQGIQTQLGENCTVGEVGDSADSRAVLRVLGGRTREAFFTVPASEPLAEYHLLVTKDATIVAFVLRGPAQVVAAARDDFRFFLSRLECVAK